MKMKRFISLFIAAVLFIVTGCSNVVEPTPTNSGGEVSRPIETDTTCYTTYITNNAKYVYLAKLFDGRTYWTIDSSINAIGNGMVDLYWFTNPHDYNITPLVVNSRDRRCPNPVLLCSFRPKEVQSVTVYYETVFDYSTQSRVQAVKYRLIQR